MVRVKRRRAVPECINIATKKRLANPKRQMRSLTFLPRPRRMPRRLSTTARLRENLLAVGRRGVLESDRSVPLAPDELMHIRRLRSPDIFGRTLGDDKPLGNEIDVIDDFQRLLHVMGDDDGTGPQGIVEGADQLTDDRQGNGIQPGE